MEKEMSVSLWCEEVEDDHQSLLESPEDDKENIKEMDGTKAGVLVEIQGQSQVRAAWDPSASGLRVVQRLLMLEQRYMPSLLYVTLIQQEPERREELVKWAMEVCSEVGCEEAVFPLCVSLLDRFLSVSLSVPLSPFCLTSACVLVASKLSECESVTVDTLCAAADYSFHSSNLKEMERVVLGTLRWDTASVTPQDFLPHFLSAVVNQEVNQEVSGEDEELVSTLRRHADTLSAMCVCDARFLGTPPSLVAAAALSCALKGLGSRAPSEVALMTEALAQLCQTDPAVLQCYSEMIEFVLRQRLSSGLQDGPTEKDEEVTETERPGTPADMTEIDF